MNAMLKLGLLTTALAFAFHFRRDCRLLAKRVTRITNEMDVRIFPNRLSRRRLRQSYGL
jgi:hypothetical protein